MTNRKADASEVPAISRWPVPDLASLPDDIRARIAEVQDKAGFVPNVFLALAHRPDEFRAFFAYHDALMLRESGLTKFCASTRRTRASPTRWRPTTARPRSRRGSARCSTSR